MTCVMKLRYLMVLALLPVFAACSKPDKTEPTESTPVPAEVVASVTPASVPDASVSDSVRTEAMPAEPSADAESTPETAPAPAPAKQSDRKSVVKGKSVSVRVDLGGRRIIKKTKKQNMTKRTNTSQNTTDTHERYKSI